MTNTRKGRKSERKKKRTTGLSEGKGYAILLPVRRWWQYRTYRRQRGIDNEVLEASRYTCDT